MVLAPKRTRFAIRIGADVSRHRKQKAFRFVVSRIEDFLMYKMLRFGSTYQGRVASMVGDRRSYAWVATGDGI